MSENLQAVTCAHCGHTEHLAADTLFLSFMTDMHTFKRVPSGTPEEIVEWMVQGVIEDIEPGVIGLRYGMLCPVKVYAGDRWLRTVGPAVHPGGASDEHIRRLYKDSMLWIAAMYADPDIPRLLSQRKDQTP